MARQRFLVRPIRDLKRRQAGALQNVAGSLRELFIELTPLPI